MKKLKKLNLNNSEILNASQMKNIVGGYTDGGYAKCSKECTGTCTKANGTSGTCGWGWDPSPVCYCK